MRAECPICLEEKKPIVALPCGHSVCEADYTEPNTQHTFADEKMIDELVDISGIEKQTLSMREVLNQQFKARESSDNLSKDEFEKLKSILLESFNEKEILKNTKAALLEGLTEEEIKEVIDLHKSPLFIKTTRLEEEASSSEGIKNLQVYAQKINEAPPSEERIKLVQKLDSNLKISEVNSLVIFQFTKGFMKAFEGREFSEEESTQLLKILATQMTQVIYLQLFYTYKDLTDKEFGKYVDTYLTRSSLKKVNNVVTENVSKGVIDWGKKVGEKSNFLIKKSSQKEI